MPDRRRHPRSPCELRVADGLGYAIILKGRRAEIVAAFAAEVAANERLESLEVWQAEVNVTQRTILVRWTETRAPIRFRDHDEKEAS